MAWEISVCILAIALFILLYAASYIRNLKRKGLLYKIDDSKQVNVSRNNIYKETERKRLLMDVYHPQTLDPEVKLPVVFLVHGEGPEVFIRDAKDWNLYSSYGKLLANMGFVAVTFNHRRAGAKLSRIREGTSDIYDALDFVKKNATQWNIDENRICIWAFSIGGLFASPFLQNKVHSIKSFVSFYGLLDLREWTSRLGEAFREYYPEHYLPETADCVPNILIVKANRDSERINNSIDSFAQVATLRKIDFKYIVHTSGRHAFDALDDNEETRKIIGQTLNFIKSYT